MVVYADSNPVDTLRAYPVLDKAATRLLVERLFPDAQIEEIGDQLLSDALNPPADVAYVGCYSGVDLVCCWRLMPDRPSQLDDSVRTASERRNIYLQAVHADADWTMFGVWQNGELTRSLSACPDPGVIEDIGDHLKFEEPHWTGDEDLMWLGEAALRDLFGIVLDGEDRHDDVEAELIPVVGYKISPDTAPSDAAA